MTVANPPKSLMDVWLAREEETPVTLHGCCPQCGTELSNEKFSTGFAVCDCGWFDDQASRRAVKESEKKSIRTMLIGSMVMIAVFAHFVTWGTYAISIPVMKLQQLTGTLSNQGYQDLADSCINLGRYSCAQQALLEQYTVRKDIRGIAALGKLNMRMGKNSDALQAYAAYFKVGGQDPEAAYLNGKLLEVSGRTEEAFRAYELAIAKSEKTLPILSMGAIVRLMIKIGRYQDAYTRIQEFHDASEQAKGYLNTELAQLEAYLGKNAKSSKSGKVRRSSKRVAGV